MISSGNTVTPLVLGVDRTPPTNVIFFDEQFNLDPKINIETSVDVLQPAKRGMDFWESLEGMLVTIPNPRAVGRVSSPRTRLASRV